MLDFTVCINWSSNQLYLFVSSNYWGLLFLEIQNFYYSVFSCVLDEAETVASKVPSILKRLGSSVPMVEDLEREHQNEHQSSGTNVLPSSSSMAANFPLSKTTKFMTQLSSSENQSSSYLLQSFHSNYLGQTSTIVSNLPTDCDVLNPNSVLNNIEPFCTGTVSQSSYQNVASLQSCSTSLSNYQQNNVERKKISSMHNLPTNFFLPVSTGNCTNSSNFTTSLLSTNSKGDNSATFSHTCLSSPILGKTKSQNLLTPADIETIPSSIISAVSEKNFVFHCSLLFSFEDYYFCFAFFSVAEVLLK